jgi:hypothetical protein
MLGNTLGTEEASENLMRRTKIQKIPTPCTLYPKDKKKTRPLKCILAHFIVCQEFLCLFVLYQCWRRLMARAQTVGHGYNLPLDLYQVMSIWSGTTWFARAGVNQQPPMHQLRMRPLKPFWDEPKPHPPCPKILFFSASTLPQNFSLQPTYLPPTSLLLPLPSYLPPPTSHRQSLGAVWSRVDCHR